MVYSAFLPEAVWLADYLNALEAERDALSHEAAKYRAALEEIEYKVTHSTRPQETWHRQDFLANIARVALASDATPGA